MTSRDVGEKYTKFIPIHAFRPYAVSHGAVFTFTSRKKCIVWNISVKKTLLIILTIQLPDEDSYNSNDSNSFS